MTKKIASLRGQIKNAWRQWCENAYRLVGNGAREELIAKVKARIGRLPPVLERCKDTAGALWRRVSFACYGNLLTALAAVCSEEKTVLVRSWAKTPEFVGSKIPWIGRKLGWLLLVLSAPPVLAVAAMIAMMAGFLKLIVWSWGNALPGLIRWNNDPAKADKGHRAAAIPVVVLIAAVLTILPFVSLYPAIWVKAYVTEYNAVIYQSNPVVERTEDGAMTIKMVIALGEQLLDQGLQANDLAGWPTRTPIFGLNNSYYLQEGELTMLRLPAEWLRFYYTRPPNGVFDERMITAHGDWMYHSDRRFFPNSETVYREGLNAWKAYLADLQSGRAKTYPVASSFSRLLERMVEGLSGYARQLEASSDLKTPTLTKSYAQDTTRIGEVADTETVGWWDADRVFYGSQGALRVVRYVLDAASHDFSDVLVAKGSTELVTRIVHDIDANPVYLDDPWCVIGPNNAGIVNHLALQSATVNRSIADMGLLIAALNK